MAGLRGNTAYFAAGRQTAKGSAAAAPKHMWPLTGTSRPSQNREIEHLQETDDRRDEGTAFLKMRSAGGAPEVYVRDNSIDTLLGAAFGTVNNSAGPTNYVHTITPSADLDYFTAWFMLGDALWEKFTDLMVNELTVKAEAGMPLTAQVGFLGLEYERLTSEPSGGWGGVTMENGAVYSFNEAAVTLAGGASALVSSFEFTLNNNLSLQQTDSAKAYDVVEGTLQMSLSFDLIFESLNEYNRFNTGTTSGTAASDSLPTTSANFTFTKGANNEVSFDFPIIAYEEFPVEQQPDGSPVVATVRASVLRGAAGVAMATAVVKNQKATTY
jgi:hypothetical protein